MTIDDAATLAGKIVVILAAAAAIGGAMRWMFLSIRKLNELLDEIRSIRPAIREEIHGHEHRWHGHTPPPAPIPTWVQPRPNGSGPGVHRAESRWY